jgi:hypothetical protein
MSLEQDLLSIHDLGWRASLKDHLVIERYVEDPERYSEPPRLNRPGERRHRLGWSVDAYRLGGETESGHDFYPGGVYPTPGEASARTLSKIREYEGLG